MNNKMTSEERDRRVLQIYDQLMEIEQRLIPTGLHIFGRPSAATEKADMLRMVASFDRPEAGARALPDLITEGLGLSHSKKSGTPSEKEASERERVDTIVCRAIQQFLGGDISHAVEFLAANANVRAEDSQPIFALLEKISTQLQTNSELDSLSRALHGEYIEPGPGADIVQNPDILPTGRNTHAVNPYSIPSEVAFTRAEAVAENLLARYREENERYPRAMALVLWGLDNIKTQGEGVGQALWLLGVRPVRDALNRVTQVEAIPLERLNRPRIDVVMTISGIFRDLFSPTVELLDRAVRLVAQLDEPDEINYVR